MATASGNFTISTTPYPLYQRNKVVGTGQLGSAWQGGAVAISADGHTAIVGGNYDDSEIGAVWIYIRSGNNWVQQGTKLVGTGVVAPRSDQGASVAISADGNTAIVGGYEDSSGQGAVWVFTRSDTTWTQQGSKLVAAGVSGFAELGGAVALSADGNTAIAGGYTDSSFTGAAWVFTRSGGIWAQQGDKLVGTGAVGNADQGISVAISADGNTAMVGGTGDNSANGAVWAYTRTDTTWTQQGPKLSGAGVNGARQGACVKLSADGNTAIVGGSAGYAIFIFTRSGGTWTQQGSNLAPVVNLDGNSLALSADGNTAIVGGGLNINGSRASRIVTRLGSIWTQQDSQQLVTGVLIGFTGCSLIVALSADGSTCIEGADQDNSATGAAWFYVADTAAACASTSATYNQAICSGDSISFAGHALYASGTYYDSLTSLGGCDSVIILDVTVLNPMNSSYSYKICSGSSYSFGGQDISAPGTYFDTLTSAVSGCDSIVTLQLSVDSLNAYFTLIPTSTPHYWDIVNQCSGNGLSYTWNWGDSSANSTGDTASHTYAAAGYYNVCVTITDTAGCTAHYCDTNVYLFKDQSGQMVYLNVVNYPNGINELNAAQIRLYPNPNKGSFTLQTSASIGSTYTISDMLGHIIVQRAIKADSEAIEMPDVADGVYTLSLAGIQPMRFAVLR
jgi:hypothetical protein